MKFAIENFECTISLKKVSLNPEEFLKILRALSIFSQHKDKRAMMMEHKRTVNYLLGRKQAAFHLPATTNSEEE